RVELQRAVVVLERGREVARVPVGEAEQVLDVGVARIAQRRRAEHPDRARPLLSLDRLAAAGVVGVELVRFLLGRLAARTECESERDRQSETPHYFAAWSCLISCSSARS